MEEKASELEKQIRKNLPSNENINPRIIKFYVKGLSAEETAIKMDYPLGAIQNIYRILYSATKKNKI